ncbi:uncharacterized protein LOC62_05G007299 [Vanrija pseudolonga]|uniref:Uncharacterized protein n=1 Tax=Vanrija pseudolonga TaxID=143232 RepID=A0AAF0YFR1_9TREE|nr:hypothetical protein LOC62_05G007299 [Vanrija pseudolonga]
MLRSVATLVCVLPSNPIGYDELDLKIRGTIVKFTGKNTTDTTHVLWTPRRGQRYIPPRRDDRGKIKSWLRLSLTAVAWRIATGFENCRFTLVNVGAVSAKDAEVEHDIAAWDVEADRVPESWHWLHKGDYLPRDSEGDDYYDSDDDGDDDGTREDGGEKTQHDGLSQPHTVEPGEEVRAARIEAGFRSQVARYCREAGLDDEATRKRQELIRFITMDEYFAEPGLLDVFDAEELAPWLT